jgi:hypothetical protein
MNVFDALNELEAPVPLHEEMRFSCNNPLLPDFEPSAAGFIELVETLRAFFSPLRFTATSADLGQSPFEVYEWRAEGRHTGSFFGVAPTQAAVSFHGRLRARVEDELITDLVIEIDHRPLLVELGVAPGTRPR